jgi:hypothetical protein
LAKETEQHCRTAAERIAPTDSLLDRDGKYLMGAVIDCLRVRGRLSDGAIDRREGKTGGNTSTRPPR